MNSIKHYLRNDIIEAIDELKAEQEVDIAVVTVFITIFLLRRFYFQEWSKV